MSLFEKLKSNWKQTWFIDKIWEPSYVHAVKGHLRSSCGQRSYTKVKGHLRSDWNVKMASFEKLKSDLNQSGGSRSDVNLHYPQTATAGDTSGPGTTKYFQM